MYGGGGGVVSSDMNEPQTKRIGKVTVMAMLWKVDAVVVMVLVIVVAAQVGVMCASEPDLPQLISDILQQAIVSLQFLSLFLDGLVQLFFLFPFFGQSGLHSNIQKYLVMVGSLCKPGDRSHA